MLASRLCFGKHPDISPYCSSVIFISSLYHLCQHALDKNRSGLISIFGEPEYGDWIEDEYDEGNYNLYRMEWYPYPLIITAEMSDPNDKASMIAVRHYSDGISNEEYQEYLESSSSAGTDNDLSSPVTADGNTLSVGNIVYAKINVFGVSVSYYRGYVISIDNANSVNVAWDTVLENRLWAYEECAILSDRDSISGYSYYSNAAEKIVPLIDIKFNLPANQLYSKMP
jgi:hypothetical protein